MNLDIFETNPFKSRTDYIEEKRRDIEMGQRIKQSQKIRDYVSENYKQWSFKELLDTENILSTQIKFYFKFEFSDSVNIIDRHREKLKYICKDGRIKEMVSLSENDLYYVYSRTEAIKMRNVFQQAIDKILYESKVCSLGSNKNFISIKFEKCGKPTHLFTKQEIAKEMRKADDRNHNQLVIDENGYAKVIKDEGYGHLFPVRHEIWNAGNVYVGKYSKLSTLEDDYISSLQGWLAYLDTGREQYIDYIRDNMNEEELLNEIKKYY